jgi:hypothetical protein
MKFPNVLGKDFNTKYEANAHFKKLKQELIKRDEMGKLLTEETVIKSSQMFNLISDYLETDDEEWFQRKMGPFGIESFKFVRDNYNNLQLNLHQKSNDHDSSQCLRMKEKKFCFDCADVGNVEPLSFTTFSCFGAGAKKSHKKHRLTQACRRAVDKQKQKYRDSRKDECEKCGTDNYPENLEIDHKDLSFKTIFENFKKEYNYTEEFLHTQVHKYWDTWYFFNPSDVLDCWVKYHETNAVYQMLCKPCHKKKTKEERAA